MENFRKQNGKYTYDSLSYITKGQVNIYDVSTQIKASDKLNDTLDEFIPAKIKLSP